MSVTPNPHAPLTTDLALIDGEQAVAMERATLRECTLALRIEGVATGTSGADAATRANALYAQALHAVTHAPAVAALVTDLREGNPGEEDGAAHGHEAHVSDVTGAGHVAGFVLHMTAEFDEDGPATKRAAIRAAVAAALAASTPLGGTCAREQALAAVFAVVQGVEVTAERNPDRPPADFAARFFDGDMTVDAVLVNASVYRCAYAVEIFDADPDDGDTRAEAVMAALRAADRFGGLADDSAVEVLDPTTLHEDVAGSVPVARIAGTVTVRTVADEPMELAA